MPSPSTPPAGLTAAQEALLARLDALGAVSDRDPKLVGALGGAAGIAAAVGGNLTTGLSASKVEENRRVFGENRLPQKQRKPFWDHLTEALSDDTLRILMLSAACSLLFGFLLSDNKADIIQGGAILLAVVVVSFINSFQNWSKDKEFQSLAAYTSKDDVRVVRGGAPAEISARELVVGDIVRLRGGDLIPADGVLVEGHDVEVNMSSLNGEQEPSSREVDGDSFMHNSALVAGGSDIRLLVTAVGVHTTFGRLAKDVTEAEEQETPLQEKLKELAEQIGKVGTAIGALTFFVLTALWLWNNPHHPDVLALIRTDFTALVRFFIVGVTIVVVAVPEGLPLAVTISLAFSMQRMLADRNLVRELQACETMGSATVVASDKTGTLTENRMKVVRVFLPAPGGGVSASSSSVSCTVDLSTTTLADALGSRGALQRLAHAIALNSEANLRITASSEAEGGGERVAFDGSPTEGALLALLRENGVDYEAIREEAGKPLARRAFNKVNKFQTTITKASEGGAPISIITGAPEVVLGLCSHIHGSDGKNYPIGKDDEMRAQLQAEESVLAKDGLRVIAVAFRRLTGPANTDWRARVAKDGACPAPDVETGLSLWALFGIQDPPRPGVPEAVAKMQKAGVRVMMVTGDAQETAVEIARQCGILGRGSRQRQQSVLTGAEFRALNLEAQQEAASNLAVLARCSPTDKLLLVRALQANDEVVAVTGDGTNDAPALKAANVGLSMGIAGTEVAKEASKIVITDDNFASIVATVRWGRSIKQNIRKFLVFQLTINMVALTLTFMTACLNNGSTEAFPIKPVQLLWINLIMDSFAALMLATEPPSERLMDYKPQGREEALITPTMFKNMFGHAVFQTALLVWLTRTESGSNFFGIDYKAADDLGDVALQRKEDTIVFNTFVWLQIFNLFNCRAVHDEWNILEGFMGSYITHFILAIIIVLQFAMVQGGGEIMQTAPLTWDEWRACIGLGALSIPVGYLLKLVPVFGRELNAMKDAEDLAETVSAAAQGGSAAAAAAGADGAEEDGGVATKLRRRPARGAAAAGAAAKPTPAKGAAAKEATPPSSTSGKRRGGK
jgi:P-type Ca2+ transporter type 2C